MAYDLDSCITSVRYPPAIELGVKGHVIFIRTSVRSHGYNWKKCVDVSCSDFIGTHFVHIGEGGGTKRTKIAITDCIFILYP